MSYEMKDGSGSLFRADKKSENAPDYEGKLMLNEREWRIAGWLKTTPAGKKWMSLKVEPPRAKDAPIAPAARKINPDKDIPF